jgi:hypothetical protein
MIRETRRNKPGTNMARLAPKSLRVCLGCVLTNLEISETIGVTLLKYSRKCSYGTRSVVNTQGADGRAARAKLSSDSS